MSKAEDLQCPVCRARFRESLQCPRCGADLKPLMTLILESHNACEEARAAILSGDYQRAAALASTAQKLHHTPFTKRLSLLASWLAQVEINR